MPVDVILIGPPGAGKSTQAVQLAQSRGLLRVSAEDLLRRGGGRPSAVVGEGRALVRRGECPDDDTIVRLVRDRLASVDVARGCVFDGIPRTLAQAASLDALLRSRTGVPPVVIDLHLTEADALRRLAARRTCASCGVSATGPLVQVCTLCGARLVARDDDRPEVAFERVRRYATDIRPVLSRYRRMRALRTLDAGLIERHLTRLIHNRVDQKVAALDAQSRGLARALASA